MTPFGKLMRDWRAKRSVTLSDQAAYLGVSAAYLSALEHGKRGRPSFAMVDQICVYFELIWDEAEQLKEAALYSHPKPTIDTTGLSVEAVRLANQLAHVIDRLTDADCAQLSQDIKDRL